MGAEKSQHSAGWYAGALVFWLLSAWLVTVGLSSIIPQIFWPAGDVHSDATSCAPALRELRTELLTRTSQSIATPSSDASNTHRHDELLAWFADWDQRLFVAKPACSDDEREAWRELTRLRHGMQGLIERFEREEAPHIERLDQLLEHGAANTAKAEARAHPLEDHTP